MGKHRVSWRTGLLVLGLGAAVLAISPPVEAQKSKGKSRPAETKYLMRCISQPTCSAVKVALEDKGPADDKAWEKVVAPAAVLNELGYLLMDDGRCPDKEWAGACKEMRESAAKLLEAAKAKKLDDARTAFKGVTDSCAACHAAHRDKKKD